MKIGDTEVMREEENIRILKIGCRGKNVSYCVLGNGSTRHYTDYDEALDEFNLRLMKVKYGKLRECFSFRHFFCIINEG